MYSEAGWPKPFESNLTGDIALKLRYKSTSTWSMGWKDDGHSKETVMCAHPGPKEE